MVINWSKFPSYVANQDITDLEIQNISDIDSALEVVNSHITIVRNFPTFHVFKNNKSFTFPRYIYKLIKHRC